VLAAVGAGRAFAAPPCARPRSGAVVQPPPDVYSVNGRLTVALTYDTAADSTGETLYCFQTADGSEAPTLHVFPGDTIDITLTDRVPEPPGGTVAAGRAPMEMATNASTVCGATTMDTTSVNMHFHGMNVAPRCHEDEVIHTIINSGQTFRYVLKVPVDEPPGMYWYHPHIHGQSETAVLGGASGAIEVEGIQSIQPAVLGLKQRFLVLRDQPVGGVVLQNAPGWNVSVNYVPILYPNYQPAVIEAEPGRKEFWRVVNAAADTIMDLAVTYDGVPQTLRLVALDGVPTGSQDGAGQGTLIDVKHILVPPAGRAEFIVTTPPAGTRQAVFLTRKIDTGPQGDNDPGRPLAVIRVGAGGQDLPVLTPLVAHKPAVPRFNALAQAPVTGKRLLYFSEAFVDVNNPAAAGGRRRASSPGDASFFYITVEGQTPTLFSPDNPPAITTHQGAVEDWTIQNQTLEDHEFHIHQIHFLLLARNGKAVPVEQQQMLDTVNVPYWSGQGPYPSVTLRMDFRGQVVGDFVYHCHILNHEDHGMMAIVRVLPKEPG
jgi:FtsP/CotA-like multicopper oxidase with cupredoxin domain